MGSPPHPHVVHGPDSGSHHRCRRLNRAAAAPMKPAAMVFSFDGTGQAKAKAGPCASRPPEPFQPSCSAGCFHRTAGPLNQIRPMCQVELKFLFPFQVQFKLPKSYQFKYLSKIHKTSSIGFLNSCSIKEKYQTEQ
jgi:hypothetical protein